MGYYIETPHNHGKADWLIQNHGAVEIQFPVPFLTTSQELHVCVVDNGPFEAAGIAFSEQELRVFSAPDRRPKRWLLMTKAKVIELCPAVSEALTH